MLRGIVLVPSGAGRPADFVSAAIPGGVRHWVVDPNTTHQTHFGWGAQAQIGQALPTVVNLDPPWSEEICDNLVRLGIDTVYLELYPGFVKSDADYWQLWFNAGAPWGSGATYDNYILYRYWPLTAGTVSYFSQLNSQLGFIDDFRRACEAYGKPFRWYVKVVQYDDSPVAQANKPAGAMHLADNPSSYADIIKGAWDYFAANWPQVGLPFALDACNESDNQTLYGAAGTKLAACIVAARNALALAGYPEPEWWAPSYEDGGEWTATRADAFWNADGGSLRAKLRLASHIYNNGSIFGSLATARSTLLTNLANIATIAGARSGGVVDSEAPWKPLSHVAMLTRGLGQGSMIVSAGAVTTGVTNAIMKVDPNAPVGAQTSYGEMVQANRLIWRTIRRGDVRVGTTRQNLVDTDDAECAVYRDPATGRYRGVAVTNNANAIWVQVPAGKYRVTRCLCSSVHPYNRPNDSALTTTSPAHAGWSVQVATGEGIHLNGQDSNAAGVFAFVQEE